MSLLKKKIGGAGAGCKYLYRSFYAGIFCLHNCCVYNRKKCKILFLWLLNCDPKLIAVKDVCKSKLASFGHIHEVTFIGTSYIIFRYFIATPSVVFENCLFRCFQLGKVSMWKCIEVINNLSNSEFCYSQSDTKRTSFPLKDFMFCRLSQEIILFRTF